METINENSAMYLIAHIGHTQNNDEHICWWRPESKGYTICIDKAGRYSEDEAQRICVTGTCVAVPVAIAEELARSTPYYRRSDGTLAKLYDGDNHRPVPNDRRAWDILLGRRLGGCARPEKPTPIGAKARAIYLPSNFKG